MFQPTDISNWRRQRKFNERQYRREPDLPRLVILADGSVGDVIAEARCWAVGDWLRHHGWRVTVVPPIYDNADREDIVRREHAQVLMFSGVERGDQNLANYGDVPVLIDLSEHHDLNLFNKDPYSTTLRMASGVVTHSVLLSDIVKRVNSSALALPTPLMLKPKWMKKLASNKKRGQEIAWGFSGSRGEKGFERESQLLVSAVEGLSKRAGVAVVIMGVSEKKFYKSLVASLRELGVTCELHKPMSLESTAKRVSLCSVMMLTQSHELPVTAKTTLMTLASAAAGTPCVAGRTREFMTMIRHEEEGLLTDANGWASQVERLLGDVELRKRLGENWQSVTVNHRGIDVTGKRLDTMLHQVIREHRL